MNKKIEREIANLSNEKSKLNDEISIIKANPVEFSNKELIRIKKKIDILPKRKATKKGNKTMRDLFVEIKGEIEGDKEGYANKEIKYREERAKQLDRDISLLERSNGNRD